MTALESGYHLATYDILASTNTEAKKVAEKGAPSGTVIWSRAQTAGKGRHGTKWISPPGNFYVSILLRMDCEAKIVSQLAFLTALAVRDAMPKAKVMFKWPNDILSNARKLGGILLEAKTSAKGKTNWVVVGVGLNVASYPPDKEVDRPATSLKAIGYKIEIEELLQKFLDSFAEWIKKWEEKGFEPIRESWKKNAAFLGETVTINLDRKRMSATFKDINQDGELVILLPDGQEIAISAGDLFLGKPKD